MDGYELKHYNLMPMGNGQLFLPIKAEIRKKIKKQAGDYVEVILYPDLGEVEVPENFRLCLQDEPTAWEKFRALPDPEKRRLLKWIEAPGSEEGSIERKARTVNDLAAS